MHRHHGYIPALGHRLLTPGYDWLLERVFHEQRFKDALVREAGLNGDERVLDIGCGTGTLTLSLARACPRGEVVGLDADPEVLVRARAKAARAGLAVTFIEGTSDALPYPDGAFDRVTSSLMIHHLVGPQKARTFREVLRVLRPGGRLHVLDFGPPEGLLPTLVSRLVLRHLEHTSENLRGELPSMIEAAGFEAVQQSSRFPASLGTIHLLHAAKK